MSRAPHLLTNSRQGMRLGSDVIQDHLLHDCLIDAFTGYHMGITAENLAEKYNITRQEQDELALLSHQRAIDAINADKFEDEIIPVEVKTNKGITMVMTEIFLWKHLRS